MVKLLQINAVANSGSTGHIAEDLGILVQENGWESYIAYGRKACTSSSKLIRIGNKLDIYMHVLKTRFTDLHGCGSKFATNTLLQHIVRINPDIIHLHNIHGYYINYPILFNFLLMQNIPIVWTLHDCWTYTGHCAHYSEIKCNKWQYQCTNCPNINGYPRSYYDNSKLNYHLKKKYFASLKNLTIVTVSNWLMQEVKQSFLSIYPMRVIYNGINLEIFRPTFSDVKRECNITNKFLILGVASTWGGGKGLNDFIELSYYLSQDEIIVLIGLDKQQIKSLPNNIYGFERTENVSKLVEWYSAADVYVNFSTEETFGMTTAESLACGTPVLVYNSTACAEIVTSEVGFVVEPHDVLGAYRIIKQLRFAKNNYENKCRSYACEKLNKNHSYKQYWDLYNKLISGRKYK